MSQSKKNVSNYLVGLGLILGSALGFTYGIITNGNSAISGAIGAWLGIVVGSIIQGVSSKKK